MLILLILLAGRLSLNLSGVDNLPFDTDGEDEFVLGGNEKGLIPSRSTLGLDNVALSFGVLGSILLGTFENDAALLLVGLR